MRIFLAFPFTSYLTQDGDGKYQLYPQLKSLLLRIESALVQNGHTVFLSHQREEFGAKLWEGDICTPFDMLEMRRADCVIALPEKSYGVHIELGWATAMGKPVFLVLDESQQFTSPLLQGLSCVGHTQIIPVSQNWLSDVPTQVLLCEKLAGAVVGMLPVVKREACAFLSTSFGFGPVSKAVTIARELKRQAPHLEAHYFGSGVDYDFAKKSSVFDHIFRIDVDQHEILLELIPQLGIYHSVFSVLNFDILSVWPEGHPPLYLVDSLAWMWPAPPPGLDKARAYFVQNYLVPQDRIKNWGRKFPLILVDPIRPELEQQEVSSSTQQLLVNFSGCANPFAPTTLFERYVEVLAQAVLMQAKMFDRVIFCCNEQLSEHLRHILTDRKADVAGHLPHNEFLDILSRSSALLTAPGITTTLEANALGKKIRFLLPQNYSQALMSEWYRTTTGDLSCMALSQFLPELAVPSGLTEEEGVIRVIRSLEEILYHREEEVLDMLGDILRDQASSGPLHIPVTVKKGPTEPGQCTIVKFVLSQAVATL